MRLSFTTTLRLSNFICYTWCVAPTSLLSLNRTSFQYFRNQNSIMSTQGCFLAPCDRLVNRIVRQSWVLRSFKMCWIPKGISYAMGTDFSRLCFGGVMWTQRGDRYSPVMSQWRWSERRSISRGGSGSSEKQRRKGSRGNISLFNGKSEQRESSLNPGALKRRVPLYGDPNVMPRPVKVRAAIAKEFPSAKKSR